MGDMITPFKLYVIFYIILLITVGCGLLDLIPLTQTIVMVAFCLIGMVSLIFGYSRKANVQDIKESSNTKNII